MSAVETDKTHEEELAELQRPPRAEKVAEVERLEHVLRDATGVFLTDFRGINVARMNELRSRFREQGVEYKVIKNTLLKRAADAAGLEGWLDGLEGPVGMAVGAEDAVAPAKIIDTFRDEHKREGEYLSFRGGLVQGTVIEEETFQRLARLPGRDELIAKLLYLLTYPMRGLVTVLNGVPRSLVLALEDLRKKREAGSPVEAAAQAAAEPEAATAAEGETPAEESEDGPKAEVPEEGAGAEDEAKD